MNLVSQLILGFLLLSIAVSPAVAGEVSNQVNPAQEALDSETNADINIPAAGEEAEVSSIIPEDMKGAGDVTMPEIQKDVFLVLDNSGSMKKNDPDFLTSQAVIEFINGLDEETRVAIIVFDQNVRLSVPLTIVNENSRATILNSLDQIDYQGQYTNSPAAIERAIYELKTTARMDARKLIVFMTDGIVDTGNPQRDIEKSKWLKTDLADDAGESGISIYGIAFTEDADFELIQSLAQRTNGEYYRVLKAEDLENVFTSINDQVNHLPGTGSELTTAETGTSTPAQQPVYIEIPVDQGKMSEEERMRSMLILVALSVLIIAVIVMVWIVFRSNKSRKDQDQVQDAYINDLSGKTLLPNYKLGTKPVMFGRVAGTATDHMDYIIVPESTIGRRHALITYKDYSYWIADQGSINGTFVNNKMITGEVRLKHGDRIRLYKTEFEFVMPDMVEAEKTVMSNTVLASTTGNIKSTDFDLTDSSSPDKDKDDILRKKRKGSKFEEEETLMLDGDDETIGDEDKNATLRSDPDDDMTLDNFLDLDEKEDK